MTTIDSTPPRSRIDTRTASGLPSHTEAVRGSHHAVTGRSLVVLTAAPPPEAPDDKGLNDD